MKTLLFPLAFLALSLMTTSPTYAQTSSLSRSDISAIKAVTQGETTAWNNRDLNATMHYWANRPDLSSTHVFTNGMTFHEDDNFEGAKKRRTEILGTKAGTPTGSTFINDNYVVRGNTHAAYATYHQVTTTKDGTKNNSYESRYLEKIGSDWKVVGMTAISYKPKTD